MGWVEMEISRFGGSGISENHYTETAEVRWWCKGAATSLSLKLQKAKPDFLGKGIRLRGFWGEEGGGD